MRFWQSAVNVIEFCAKISCSSRYHQTFPGSSTNEVVMFTAKGSWYFWKIGEHLDKESATLCAGSRNSDGRVPSVSWRGGGLVVYWYYPGSANGHLRARSVVS